MNNRLTNLLLAICAVGTLIVSAACTGRASTNSTSGSESKTATIRQQMPFNADSAYFHISRQVEMGPRVPGTDASRECAEWISGKLRSYGADTVITQSFTAKAHTGETLPLTNVMGRFGSPDRQRILLVAHYDTRPWADRENSHENFNKPIPGANDGASGVAVLLEIARQFAQKRPDVAVDMLFVDGEDYGKADGWSNNDSTWCLGTQYWTGHMPADYNRMLPRYGILLDMVGGHHARFLREFISDRFASEVLDKVWQVAQASGYSSNFINKRGGSAVDDHLFLNYAGIPTIDIIDCNNAETNSFPSTWHTLNDDMKGIDRNVLKAVGQSVTNVVYLEKP